MISVTNADVARTMTRCLIDWSRPLGDEQAIDRVTTITNPQFAGVGNANIAFTAAPPDAATIDEVNRTLAADGRRCVRWVIEQGGGAFARAGWRHELHHVYRLASWSPRPLTTSRIVSARAAPAQTADLLAVICNGDALRTQAAIQQLDDPRYELRVALQQGTAVACGGLLISGDAGLIVQVYTSAPHRRRGLARAICDQLIDLAARATLKHVLLTMEPKNEPAVQLYKSIGFTHVGTFDKWNAE
jgi:ribosomal protein S18 acetylase RimI-like enzyme